MKTSRGTKMNDKEHPRATTERQNQPHSVVWLLISQSRGRQIGSRGTPEFHEVLLRVPWATPHFYGLFDHVKAAQWARNPVIRDFERCPRFSQNFDESCISNAVWCDFIIFPSFWGSGQWPPQCDRWVAHMLFSIPSFFSAHGRKNCDEKDGDMMLIDRFSEKSR